MYREERKGFYLSWPWVGLIGVAGIVGLGVLFLALGFVTVLVDPCIY